MSKWLSLVLWLNVMSCALALAAPVSVGEVKTAEVEALGVRVESLEDRLGEIERLRDWVLLVTGGSCVGVFVVCSWVYRKFREKGEDLLRRSDEEAQELLRRSNEQMEKRFAELIKSNPDVIQDMIDRSRMHLHQRRGAEVAIFGKSSRLERILARRGFQNIQTLDPRRLGDVNIKEFHAVIFNLEEMQVDEAVEVIERDELDYPMAYSPGHVKGLPPGKATFCNSHITLFARLMELLAFREEVEA